MCGISVFVFIFLAEKKYIPLSAATRVNMCKAMQEFEQTRNSVLSKTTLTPKQKRSDVTRLAQLRRPIFEHLLWDTARRLEKGDDLPEQDDIRPTFVKRQLKHVELMVAQNSKPGKCQNNMQYFAMFLQKELDSCLEKQSEGDSSRFTEIVTQYILHLLLCIPKFSMLEAGETGWQPLSLHIHYIYIIFHSKRI